MRTCILTRGWILIGVMALLSAAGCTRYPAAPPTAEQAVTPNYLIGPGDTLNIVVWRNPDLSGTVPVRPDGKITTPLVEDITASGKTPAQLAREIEGALGKYIQQPVVTVQVSGLLGPYSQQIRVIGAATKPQALPFREGMSLMDVLIAVGGVTEYAAGNKASILRTEEGTKRQFAVRLDDLIKDGDVSANVEMRPGDVLIVPQSWF